MTGDLSENDAGAVNASTADALPISSQPSIKANSQYRMNRLSLKKKSSFRPPRSSDAPLASPSPGSSSARLPMAPEGAAAVQGKQPDPSPVASAAAGARENDGGSACSKGLKGCNEAGPSTAGNTVTVQTVPSRRPAALTGMGARFKPPGMLGSSCGHGSIPLPPPGWKPRKKDLASFDMLDNLPDLAAVVPRTAPGAAAAVPKPVEPGAAVEDRPATDPLSEQQPASDKTWQRKPFVPPRPQGRAGGSVDVSKAADSIQAGIARDDLHQATMPETRAQPALDEAGDADDPLDSHRSVAEPSGSGRETATGMDMDGADRTIFRRHAKEAAKQGASHSTVSELPEQQQQQQRRAWRQSMTDTDDVRPGALNGSAGATPNAGRAEQASGRGCTGPAGSKRLDTPGSAAAVLGPSGLHLTEPMQTAGRSTERRRHLKRLYSGNPDDDLIPSAETSRRQGASQDEDDEGLLEDLSFLRGKPSEAGTQPSACTPLLATSRRTAAAGDITSIPEPRLSFASRLGRAPGTEQPAISRFHSTAPDSENPSEVAPNGGAQPNSGEQPSEANGSADNKLSEAQQRPSSDEHGSQQGPAAGHDGDWHEYGATEADEEGPRRRVFKRLCKLSDRPQAGSLGKAAAAAGSRSLADWTDDEDTEGDKRFAALPSHAVEQGPKGSNPFARAAKRQAQEPRLANHALPARPAKAEGNHLSTTDIASVLMAPRSSHRERPASAHKSGSVAAACEEVIDLAADSSDDDDAPVEARASEQPGQQLTKRKGIVQLPPAPDYLLGRPQSLHRPGQQPTAFTPAGGGRLGGPRKKGDRSYLGAYSAADIAEGKFPGWTSAGDRDAAAVSEAVGSDHGKGKQAVADDDDGYGGEYHADVAGTSGGWGSGGDDEDPHQEEWEDWGDPGGGAGPSYASPERRQPHLREQDWQQAGASMEEQLSRRDAKAAHAGAAPSGEAAQEAGPSGRWKGPPWWTRLDDFVPVAAMRGGRDPRDGSVVHIDYSAQFSGAAAARGSGAAASGRKRGRSSSGRDDPGSSAWGRERVDASGTGGHWVTEYERRGPVKVYITATGRKLKGAAAYKASKKDNPGAAVPQEPKAKQKRRNGGWRFKRSR
ncbi:g4846 [Coccomyxa elongata]